MGGKRTLAFNALNAPFGQAEARIVAGAWSVGQRLLRLTSCETWQMPCGWDAFFFS